MKRWLIPFLILLMCWSCTSDGDPVPEEDCINPPEVSILDVKKATNCTSLDGQIRVQASQGVKPYEFKINDNDYQLDSTFSNLKSMEYTISVRDFNGCSGSITIDLGNDASTLNITNIHTTISGCGSSEGGVEIIANGEGVINYRLGNGTFQESNTFNNLAAGSYQVTAIDDSGCELTKSFTINSGVSFSTQIQSIITTNCTLVTCHDGNNSLPDFTKFENIKSRAADIKSRTQSGNMPKNRTLSQQEKDLIACWVEDGALNN
ncbi:MAG TPA: hypothetical protein PKL31_00390 [Fulvivirga sp.]|nr:hypothetical protein [Fulvivirga sp.]